MFIADATDNDWKYVKIPWNQTLDGTEAPIYHRHLENAATWTVLVVKDSDAVFTFFSS